MNKQKIGMLAMGVLFIGIGIGLFRYSAAGSDPYTAMAISISSLTRINFGTCMMLGHLIILAPVFFLDRSQIGLGSLMNMFGAGYIADFVFSVTGMIFPVNLVSQSAAMILAIALLAIGLALYMLPDGGVAPYDALAVILEKRMNGKISYGLCRMLTDGACIVLCLLFSWLAGSSLMGVIGVGTIVCMVFLGPLAQMCRSYFIEHVFRGRFA